MLSIQKKPKNCIADLLNVVYKFLNKHPQEVYVFSVIHVFMKSKEIVLGCYVCLYQVVELMRIFPT